MPFEPTNLRLLSALVAGAVTVSGCVTTFAVPTARLVTLAGLPENKEAYIQTGDELETVDGSTEVTLRSEERGTQQVRLSRLRSEEGALILPGNGQTLLLPDIWGAEITKVSPGKTVGLVAIVVGTVLLGGLIAYEVALSRESPFFFFAL